MEVDSIILISVPTLTTAVIIVAIETVGIVQFLKNFIHPKKKNSYSILSFIVTVVCGWMNTSRVPGDWRELFDTIFLGLAVTQLAWDVIVKGFPSLVAHAMKFEVKEDNKE